MSRLTLILVCVFIAIVLGIVMMASKQFNKRLADCERRDGIMIKAAAGYICIDKNVKK